MGGEEEEAWGRGRERKRDGERRESGIREGEEGGGRERRKVTEFED